ncbi:MAG: ABC transporter permease subunit, partial [Gaiellaceae bacterium]
MSVSTSGLANPVSTRLRDPGVTGFVGILLAVLAALLAIPPVEERTIGWTVALGIVAIAFGIWTATRGRRRLGYGAAVAGALGIGLGILATRSSTSNLQAVFDATLIAQMFAAATPLVFGAIGGMFSERSGVVNIGLEGMMLMGAFWGVYGADKGGSWVVGILVGTASGALLALVYAYFAIHLRSDQIVGGTAINFLALGITGYFFFQLYHGNYVSSG